MLQTVERALTRLIIALGTVTLASYVALAFVHLGTLYDVNQTSGAWLSYAWYLGHGTLYPPLYEGGWYAGTRYFPGFFALHAAVAQVTGEYLSSGKLVTLASTIAAISALAVILRRKTKDLTTGVALSAVVLATYIGHKGSLTIRGDVLPLALSLWALAILEPELDRPAPRGRVLLTSALLAGLAPLAKFTAFHALTAGFLALVQRDKKRALVYGAAGFFVFVVGTFLTNLASDGRFFASLAGTAVAPPGHARTLAQAAATYLEFVRMDACFLVLLPTAFVGLARLGRPVDPWRIYFVLQLVISLGFFFDTGAEYNHLIDLLVASVILGVELWSTTDVALLRIATLAAFVLAFGYGLITNHRAAWTAPERGTDPRRAFADDLGLGRAKILSHDPTVPVLLDERPVISDDFQYRVLVMRDVVPKDELPGRVLAAAFDRIVLLNPPEPSAEDPEFKDVELGPWVAHAIRTRYELDRHVGKYWVYRPRAVP